MSINLNELSSEFNNLKLDYDLKRKNWFNIGGKTKIYYKADNLEELIKFLKKALPLTILTAIFCVISLFFLNNIYDLNSSILKVIFIGLASLTFPHILLEYFLEKNEK